MRRDTSDPRNAGINEPWTGGGAMGNDLIHDDPPLFLQESDHPPLRTNRRIDPLMSLCEVRGDQLLFETRRNWNVCHAKVGPMHRALNVTNTL